MPKPITVLVSGATGHQGGAVTRLMLDRGHRVKALTRRPDSIGAEALSELGAEIVKGDLEDGNAMERVLKGVDAFFLVATPFERGVEGEVRAAKRAVEAARTAGVRHVVYSSVGGADRLTGIPHFASKHQVEVYLENLGVPYTIVAPVFFMENLRGPMFVDRLRAGKLSMPLPASRSLQVIAVADIASFVRLVLERPTEFLGRRIDIASDELTGTEMAELLTQATGSPIGYEEASLEAVRAQSDDFARMWEWFDRVGYDTDIAELRRDYPDVGWHTFRAWARGQDWSVLDQASAEQPTV